jgi:hypothetical protein
MKQRLAIAMPHAQRYYAQRPRLFLPLTPHARLIAIIDIAIAIAH